MSHSENDRKNHHHGSGAEPVESRNADPEQGNHGEDLSEEKKKNGHKDHKKSEKDEAAWEREIGKLNETIRKLEEDNALLKDGYVRKVAEFDNYKKRVARDLESSRISANRELILEILPIFDNFGRALVAGEKNPDFKNLFEGLRITHSQVNHLLGKLDVKPIEAVGKPFDHNLHEALMMEEREDVEHDTTVVEELEKGYLLGDLVIKHSKVKVARRKNPQNA